jgi:hypothetical protein
VRIADGGKRSSQRFGLKELFNLAKLFASQICDL